MGNGGCILIAIGTLALVHSCDVAEKAQTKADDLEKRLTPIVENVIGGPEPETFYNLSPGNRVYVRVDGVPVEEYVQLLNPNAPCGETVRKPTAKGTFEYFVPCANASIVKK